MSKSTTFDRCSAKDLYEWLINMAIWYDEYIVRDFYIANQERIIELNKFFEGIEDFEKCYWITEMNKANYFKNSKSSSINSFHSQSTHELNIGIYKNILLNMIYHPKEDFNLRFKGTSKLELDKLIEFFENLKDFEKCYWLYEIGKHYEFEYIMNICRSMPD